MKKRFGKVKKFIAMLMVGVTLSSSVFYSYSIPAQAASIVVPASQSLIEALLLLFGYSVGINKSMSSSYSIVQPSVFNSLNAGETVDIGSYGSVDFSNGTSIYDFLTASSQSMSDHITGSAYNQFHAMCDYTSYKNSGFSTTNTLLKTVGDLISCIDEYVDSNIEATVGDEEVDDEYLEDLRSQFRKEYIAKSAQPLFSGDEDPDMTPNTWGVFAGIAAALAGVSEAVTKEDGTVDESAYEVPETSEYNDGEFLQKQYFTEYGSTVSIFSKAVIRDYEGDEFSERVMTFRFEFERNERNIYTLYPESTSQSVACHAYAYPKTEVLKMTRVWDDGSTSTGNTFYVYPVGDYRSLYNGVLCGSVVLSSIFNVNVPCFRTHADAAAYFANADDSGMLNKLDTSTVSEFYENTSPSTVPDNMSEYVSKSPSVQELVALANTVSNLPEEDVGTSRHIPGVEAAILAAIAALAASGSDPSPSPTPTPTPVPGESPEPSPTPTPVLEDTISPTPTPSPTPIVGAGSDGGESGDDTSTNTGPSLDLLTLLNSLWLLIMILIVLLRIFLHLMVFIINIFKIPASTGYLNDDMILGLNYIKTLEITGIGLSVYDFMMGLVYILMVFGVVKVLRHNINHIKIPKAIRGGLSR